MQMSLDLRFQPIPVTTSEMLVLGDDGSLRSTRFNDFYFRPNFGKEESTYVFLEGNQLEDRWSNICTQQSSRDFVIAETGFGSGLNFLAATDLWLNCVNKNITEQGSQTKPCVLNYIGIEKHPLTYKALVKALGHFNPFPNLSEILLKNYPDPFGGQFFIDFRTSDIPVRLWLFFTDAKLALNQLETYTEPTLSKGLKVDAWFLDGFDPKENEHMWSQEIFNSIALLSKASTTAATFTVARPVKDGFKNAGFSIKRPKGFGGKREMLTATFPNNQVDRQAPPQNAAYWRFANLNTTGEMPRNIAIVGAGIAGCTIAKKLADHGIQVDLFDNNEQLVQEASGNEIAALHPRTAKQRSIHSDFMETAFHYAYAHYKTLDKRHINETNNGLIQIDADLNTKQLSNSTETHSRIELNQLEVFAANKRSISNGIFYSHAYAIKPKSLAKKLCDSAKINFYSNTLIETIHADLHISALVKRLQPSAPKISFTNKGTQHEQSYDAIVITCGTSTKQLLSKTLIAENQLPIKTIRGQTSSLEIPIKTQGDPNGFDTGNLCDQLTAKVLCGNGYLFLEVCNKKNLLKIYIGASYAIKSNSTEPTRLELMENLDNAADLLALHPKAYDSFVGLVEDISHHIKSELIAETSQINSRFGQVKIRNRVAYRCTSPDYLPVAGPITNSDVFNKQYNTWSKNAKTDVNSVCPLYNGIYLCTALGSQGYGTAPILAESVISDILGTNNPLSEPLRHAISPQRFLVRELTRGKKSE